MKRPDLKTARRAGAACLACAAFCLWPPWAAAEDFPDARKVLLLMSVNARRTPYEGRKIIIDLSKQVPEITQYHIFHHQPDLERKEYPGLGRVTVRRGGWLWQYYSKEDVIVKRKVPMPEEWDVLQKENLELAMRNYHVRLERGAPMLGRQSLLVRFEPLQSGSRPTRKIWVDMEKGVPLRGEVYGVDGNLYLVSHFEVINYEPSSDGELFEIKAPRARIVEAAAGEDAAAGAGRPQAERDEGLWRPAVLPLGFVAKGCKTAGHRRAREVQEFFTDGLSNLSFFQGPGEHPADTDARYHQVSIDGQPARFYDFGLLRLLKWNRDSRHFVLVGELATDELLRMAQSVSKPPAKETERK